jgi:hypothetical protein
MLTTTAGAALLLLGGLMWLQLRQAAAMARLDNRTSHLLAGVTLLTDTTEGALRELAVQVEALSPGKPSPRPRAGRPPQRRIAAAFKRGRSVEDIAAAEQVSEGEVRLRLQLDQSAKERGAHAAVR